MTHHEVIDHHYGLTMIGHEMIAMAVASRDHRKADLNPMGMTALNQLALGAGTKRLSSDSMMIRREKTKCNL